MAYLVAILASLALLVAFLGLTAYEAARGVRFLAGFRAQLDTHVERAEFIVAHVDLAAFLREEVRRLSALVAHAVAHATLRAVRFAERLLTRAVRYLRMHGHVDGTPSREASREFVKTLADFKEQLEASHPEEVR